MRVAFIGRSHAFSLEPLLQIATAHEVVAVVESARSTPQRRLTRLRRRVATQRARYGRDSLPAFSRENHVPYLWLDKKSRPRLNGLLERVRPDILAIASLGHLLEKEVIALAPFGACNLHPSMLPKYRGPFPWFWQYHDFVLDIGVTVHMLDPAEDRGPIVAQAPMTLALGTDIRDAMHRAGVLGGGLMLEALNGLAAGTATLEPQEEAPAGPRARRVRRDERFIDWNEWSLARVWHFMRGTYPWVNHFDHPAGRARGDYTVGEMAYGEPGGPAGTLLRDEDGWFVPHREGRIRIRFAQ